jgi:hypothetical protein
MAEGRLCCRFFAKNAHVLIALVLDLPPLGTIAEFDAIAKAVVVIDGRRLHSAVLRSATECAPDSDAPRN